MSKPAHVVKVYDGKYTFVNRLGTIEILRYGKPWHEQTMAGNALSSLMAELDAARVVVQAARVLGDRMERMPIAELQLLAKYEEFVGITRALALHGRLCDDREPPSEWCLPAETKR